MHIGIDYGSKLAGTTVICYPNNEKLVFEQSEKKRDADQFLQHWMEQLQPENIFIDAPLSLPAAFFGKGKDFFYRECDRITKAMSPMFLGGLTARAMQLEAQLSSPTSHFFETYPAQLLRLLFSGQKFTKDRQGLQNLISALVPHLPFPFSNDPQNRHQADATLAWLSGFRYIQGKAIAVGNPAEGLIWY